MRRLDQDEKRQTSTSDMGVSVRNSLTVVSESGLYKLILRSDKEQARRFQNWVARDVLPAIRKDGGYILGEEAAKPLGRRWRPARCPRQPCCLGGRAVGEDEPQS